MDTETQKQAVGQAVRVLKKGGKLYIWGAEIAAAYPNPFVVDLDIRLISEQIHTTFGIVSDISNQTASSIALICSERGLVMEKQSVADGQFYLVFSKKTE